MKPSIGFIVSIFCFLLIAPFSTHAQAGNCQKMDVTVTVNPSANDEKASLKVETNSRDLTVTLHLIAVGDTRKDQLTITSNKIENISPGTYDLVIQSNTPGYCSETRKVTVN